MKIPIPSYAEENSVMESIRTESSERFRNVQHS